LWNIHYTRIGDEVAIRKYKEDYPGVTKTFAEKACIKTILDQRKLEQSRMAKSSTI